MNSKLLYGNLCCKKIILGHNVTIGRFLTNSFNGHDCWLFKMTIGGRFFFYLVKDMKQMLSNLYNHFQSADEVVIFIILLYT